MLASIAAALKKGEAKASAKAKVVQKKLKTVVLATRTKAEAVGKAALTKAKSLGTDVKSKSAKVAKRAKCAVTKCPNRDRKVIRQLTRQMEAQHTLRGGDSTSLDGCLAATGTTSNLSLTSAQSTQFASGTPYDYANPSPNNVILNNVMPSSIEARGVDTTSFDGNGLLRSDHYSTDYYGAVGAGAGSGGAKAKAKANAKASAKAKATSKVSNASNVSKVSKVASKETSSAKAKAKASVGSTR